MRRQADKKHQIATNNGIARKWFHVVHKVYFFIPNQPRNSNPKLKCLFPAVLAKYLVDPAILTILVAVSLEIERYTVPLSKVFPTVGHGQVLNSVHYACITIFPKNKITHYNTTFYQNYYVINMKNLFMTTKSQNDDFL